MSTESNKVLDEMEEDMEEMDELLFSKMEQADNYDKVSASYNPFDIVTYINNSITGSFPILNHQCHSLVIH